MSRFSVTMTMLVPLFFASALFTSLFAPPVPTGSGAPPGRAELPSGTGSPVVCEQPGITGSACRLIEPPGRAWRRIAPLPTGSAIGVGVVSVVPMRTSGGPS
ncbi:hypothetical protein IU443_17410 [Nocardia farcinica]|uniref:hypothetical protein n=1 Tax=Nocardia TaxID=1817 RepID=UPI0015F0DC87|nr:MULTISPECIES: hypothetical protein [Nocardia]MBA4856888.1 hypothetical protein [Nocardia farcinica]MBC9815350.1 hypothetical protein [Nocardia farcinica]MBF6247802.1 hypothetical protein [Nocardia elegans]MBF6261801.1 hypothetical protein [Nocardia farcinica]MBF6280340.1 hypothetical protein [Nocardia farcinica]